MNLPHKILLLGIPLLLAGCISSLPPEEEAKISSNEAASFVSESSLPLETISLPPGFVIDTFAENITNARSMVRAEDGTIFVGTRQEGNVYALRDTNGDWKADETYTLARDLDMPNGVAYKNGDLYVAEIDTILKFPNILENLSAPFSQELYKGYPADRMHGWKYIAFGPDGKLYVPVGAPCNSCLKDNPIYSSLTRINDDGSNFEIVAKGIRNTVGFDWHPETNQLWFTDNGRDLLGDNIPPDELNMISEKGQHFGYPYLHGQEVEDPTYYSQKPADLNITLPIQNLGPHVAALGIKFYEGDQFPSEYKHQAFIAEHGSWNRSEPIGYRVSLVRFDEEGSSTYERFASGWLKENGEAWGRPVDVLEMPDGSLLVSDDMANAIYRISYVGN